jgi:hypothetical protein
VRPAPAARISVTPPFHSAATHPHLRRRRPAPPRTPAQRRSTCRPSPSSEPRRLARPPPCSSRTLANAAARSSPPPVMPAIDLHISNTPSNTPFPLPPSGGVAATASPCGVAARGAPAAARAAGRPALRVGPGYSGLTRHESSPRARAWAASAARGRTRQGTARREVVSG